MRSGGSEGQETGRPLEKKEGTASVRGPISVSCEVATPGDTGLTNVLLPSADDEDDPLEVLSVSGADQRPLAKYRPPGGMVRVREPITILLPRADPWSLRSV
ncbi:unnamed protein product [Sphagnum balticum]